MGCVFKKRGNWYIDYYHEGRRIRKKIGHSKKVALLALADAELFSVKNSLGLTVKDMKISAFFKEYRTYAETNLAPKTVTRYQAVVDHFVGFLEENCSSVKKLSHIKTNMIEKYKTYRKNMPVSRNGRIPENGEYSPSVRNGAKHKTINTELTALKAMFNMAKKWGYLKENPVDGVKELKIVETKTPKFLSVEEVESVLENADSDFKPILQFLLYTGMRSGELVHLEWDDIDFSRNVIQIRQKEHWTPKSTERDIPLHSTLREVLHRLKKSTKNGRLFPFKLKDPSKKIRQHFMALTRKCGFPDITKVHTLRHTFASHLVMKGVPLPTLQKLLGHADIKDTMKYAHLAPGHIEEAVEKLPF